MEIKRYIRAHLIDWKRRENKKPLIVRGARQVGKTTTIKEFARSYGHSIILNLEKRQDVRFFEEFDDIKTIKEALFLSNNIPSDKISETLLFIDEIQESPRAIQFLRYFYEEFPRLSVVGAGSLLEFAMKDVKNYPVGRVEYIYMHPMNFPEYLEALGKSELLEQLNHVPVNSFAHRVLLDAFHQYALIGGMPEIIRTYIEHDSLVDLLRIYESIWATYQNDVEKYGSTDTIRRVIKHVISSAPLSLGERIKFQNFGQSNYRSREVGEAMRMLHDAKIIRLVYPTTSLEPPLRSNLRKSPRLQFLDTGLINYALDIQKYMLGITDLSSVYRGFIVPHLINQEIISLNVDRDSVPGFWVREKKESNAEVDLVLSCDNKVIPVEVKSGKVGSLRSLHQFIDISGREYAIRISAGEFKVEKHKTPQGTPFLLMNLPYYMGTKIYEYIRYFIDNFTLNTVD